MRVLVGRSAVSLVLLSAMLFVPGPFAGGTPSPPVELELRVARFDPLVGQPPLAESLRWAAEPRSGFFVVQLAGSPDGSTADRLRALGAEPLQYVPARAYLVRLGQGGAAALRKQAWVRWVGPVEPGWKLSPELGSRRYAEAGRRRGGRLEATVDLYPGEDLSGAEERLTALGIDVLARHAFGDTRRLTVLATRGQLESAARIEAVAWVEETAEIALRNIESRWVVQTGEPNVTSLWDRGLHGEGQIIGHIDGPIYYKSCFFRDLTQEIPGPGHRKIIAYRGYGSGGEAHGTHTAGTLAGDPSPVNGTLDYAGLAYQAKISHTDYGVITGGQGSESNVYEYLQLAHQDGARVHSNSWGDDDNTAYTPLVRDIDAFAYDNEDSLVIFSVSNGPQIRSPENAKNVLAVGASRNGALADEFCYGGSGPTPDGRRKPEIFAPGCDIQSALNRTLCGTVGASGTSMATPAVAAAGALVRQYFEEGWYPGGARRTPNSRTPSGALVKAVLLNSTVDMPGLPGWPSDREGWGRILLDNAVFFEGDRRRLAVLGDVRNAQGLSTGVAEHFTLRVDPGDEPLKVTLAFTEPPGALLASSTTVNDLDLEIVSPNGLRFRGNVFDFELGASVPGGDADPRNNVETVLIADPQPGEWNVSVRGAAVNLGRQGYALVATGPVGPGQGGGLRYFDHVIDDGGPLGNGDGHADPGETVTLPIALLNLRSVAADGVAAQLYSRDFAAASVGRGLVTYVSIPTGGSAVSDAPHFQVTISPDAACGTSLPFRVRSTDAMGSADSSFGLFVGAGMTTLGEPATCQPLACSDPPLGSGIGGAMRVTIAGSDDLHLAWPAVPGATLYEIWRSSDHDFGTAELIGTLTATEHVVAGGMRLAADGYYRVRAVNGCGWGGP